MKIKFSLLVVVLLVLSMALSVAAQSSIDFPDGHDPDFDAESAEEEGYWYSRYNLGALVMQSGNGVIAEVPMEMVMNAIPMVDANPDDGDTVTPPPNAAILQAVYAGGDPHFITVMNPTDFATLRWAGGDERLTTEASAWTIIKEVEWAKLFHVDDHFGTPDSDFGAQQRFSGIVLNMSAKMQAMAWLETPDNYETTLGGQYAMLIALSDLGSLLTDDALLHSASNRYNDPEAGAMFLQAADALFSELADAQPETVAEWSLLAQSVVWYAANTTDHEARATTLDLLATAGDALLEAETGSPAETAYAIRGLIEAARITGEDSYLSHAAILWDGLVADYDAASGTFGSQSTYTIDDVGIITGAINALGLFADDVIDQDVREAIFAGFFEGVVNLGGLQISAPPTGLGMGAYEVTGNPPLFFRYTNQAMPPAAGGEFGIAPVFGASATWENGVWTVDTDHFDTAGAMHASNEMVWFHADEVNGFPELP